MQLPGKMKMSLEISILKDKNPLIKSLIFQLYRDVLILEWIVLGFCLTVSYKSVLLATLVSAEYEKPIG